MVHETTDSGVEDDRKDEPNAPCEDAPWSRKSLSELEQDADQVLDDIRNIGSSSSNHVERSTTVRSKDDGTLPSERSVTHMSMRSPEGAVLGFDFAQSPPVLTEEEGLFSPLGGDASIIDDDSLRGELERLDSVTDAIRLSLVGKRFEHVLQEESLISPLFAPGAGEKDFPNSPATTEITKKKEVVVDSVKPKQNNLEDTSVDRLLALGMAVLLMTLLWLWTVYYTRMMMVVPSKCQILNAEGVIQWPTCEL